MKTNVRTILRDIQAAARIGHIESLWVALEGLDALPQVAGNHPMDETFLNQVILPVGEAVAGARVNAAGLRPLSSHPNASMRAIAAVALVEQYLKGTNGASLKDLTALTQDPRQDVRQAISLAAVHSSETSSEKLADLYQAWAASSSPNTQTLAYALLPSLPDADLLAALDELDGSLADLRPEVKVSLASAIAALGAGKHREDVLALLVRWANIPEPDHRLIARSLSKLWAAEVPEQTLSILTTLAAHAGAHKRIRRALENLYHHGGQDLVRQTLKAWEDSGQPNLAAAAADEKLNLPHKE